MSERTNEPATPSDLGQELALAKEELRRSQETLRRMAHFLSHDFRAPLRHITSFSALLQGELGKSDDRDVSTWLGFMSEGAGLVTHLVDEVLLFSRAQRAEVEEGKTALAEMFEDLEKTIDAPEEGLVIESQIGPEVVLRMSYGHAAQVFTHLIQNAVNFRKRDAGAKIALASRRNGDVWEIEIHDSGSGVRPDAIDTIFDPFYRSSESPRTSAGLGLSVARYLLALYDGSVELESEYGTSTTVRVRVPSVSE